MKNKTIKLILILVIIFILIDQLSKTIIFNVFEHGQVIGNNLIAICLEYNTNMAFGIGSGNARSLFMSLFVIFIILAFIRKQKDNIDTKTAISLSLMLGGGLGNIIDRFFRNAVLDFIKIGGFPIFNLADCFVVIGWILMIMFLVDFQFRRK